MPCAYCGEERDVEVVNVIVQDKKGRTFLAKVDLCAACKAEVETEQK